MNRIRSLLLLAALAAGGAVGCSRHYRAHTPPSPPPPPYAYRARGMAPGPGYVWVDGYWVSRGNHWHWVSGHWAPPPHSRHRRR